MLQLSFNQKVGLGFAIIILLLLTSGLSSLWNLNDINGSSSLVNETAVPVLKESNDVQMQPIKIRLMRIKSRLIQVPQILMNVILVWPL
jgi:two-component system chemotaxis sensor kinase CheA